MKRLYNLIRPIIVTCLILSVTYSFAQLTISSQMTSEITVYGTSGTYAVTVENTTGSSASNISIDIDLPTGITYSVGNFNETSSFGLTEVNPSTILFTLNTLPNNSTLTFELSLDAICEAIDYQLLGNVFRNNITVNYGVSSDFHQSNPYNILYPALSILSTSNKNTSIISGQQFQRTFQIINGGNGALSNFIITNTHTAEMEVVATSLGVLGVDEVITLSGSDFSGVGNNNSLLEQDEIINITLTYQGTSCTDKVVSSTIKVGWNGETGFCQNDQTTANTTIDFNNPNLSLVATDEFLSCFDASTSHNQQLKITNTGAGVAANINIDIFKSSGGNYDQNLLSKFDISTIQYKIGAGGSLQSISPTSSQTTTSTGDYACLGGTAYGEFVLHFDQLDPGEELYVYWDMYTCCPSTCSGISQGGWKSSVTYEDVCAGGNYSSSTIGQSPMSASMSAFTESEPEVLDGETGQFNFIISSYDNEYTTSSKSVMRVTFQIPDGLIFENNSDLLWTSAPTSWSPYSITYNSGSNTLIASYALDEPFSLPKSEIQLALKANCNATGATPNANMNITMDIDFFLDSTCVSSCGMPLICNNTVSTVLRCPDLTCNDGGMRFTNYSLKRISLGLPDNDENGFADGGGSIDSTKIKRNRAMYGDTVRATLNGTVHSGSGFTTWSNGYAEITIPSGANLSAVTARLKVNDISAAIVRQASTLTITKTINGNDATFKIDISPADMISNGALNFSGFNYSAGDIVQLTLDLKITTNIGGTTDEVTTSANFYLSQVANPTPAAQYSCNTYLENFTLIGFYFTSASKNNVTVTGCSKSIKQSYYLSIGDCCSNYAGGNIFPYEYRNWATLATSKVIIPPHYTITNIKFDQLYTRGTNLSTKQTMDGINYDFRSIDTLIFDLSQYYTTKGGIIHPSDDGFSGTVTITVSPSCEIPSNTYQDVPWWFNFNQSNYLDGGTSAWHNIAPDRIRYTPSLMAITATNPIEDGLNKTVIWQVKLKNPFGSSSLSNAWMHLVSPSNNVTIQEVKETTAQNASTLTGDLYLLGSFTNGQTRTFDITATYTACTPENLIVYAGYACEGYPSNYADFTCPHNNLSLEVQPKPTQLQVQISGKTVGEECSNLVEVELLMQSVRQGAVDSLNMIVNVPAGLSILLNDDSSAYSYPILSNFNAFNDPVLNGQQYTIPVYSLDSSVNANGLPGILQVGNNKIKVKMQFELQNNIAPGDYLQFSFDGKRTCNEALPQINLAYDPKIKFEEIEIAGMTTTAGDNWSVSWGDYNDDGFDDVFITEYSKTSPNLLFMNNGDGSFTKITSGAIVTDLASSLASTWGDYDNDGDLDLFVANNIGFKNFLYSNNGDGSFTAITSGNIVNYDGYSHSASWADYDNDGYLDLFVCDFMPTRFNLLYHNNGDGTFEQIKEGDIVRGAAHSIGATWADADGDRDLDLFVPNAGEPNYFYRNDGGTFTAISNIMTTDSSYSTGSSWGDYDNDGDLDLFVANASKNQNFFYQNDGAGNFTSLSLSPTASSRDTHGSTWADFDNDGFLDLYFTNDKDQMNEYFSNNGDGNFSAVESDITVANLNSFGTAVADIENDGDLDLFIANHTDDENNLFKNTKGACTNYICITLEGTTSNKNGIGARIFVTATVYGNAMRQLREVSTQTGGGAGGQNTLKAIFGIGDATIVDTIRVEWPSGITQTLTNQAINDCFTIIEDGGSLICGTAYNDLNNNCVQDAGETNLANQPLLLSPINRTIYSDSAGNYATYVVDGNYTLTPQAAGNHTTSCSAINVIVTGNGTNSYCGNDFGFAPSCTDPDISVNMATAVMRRGFADDLFIEVKNTGGATATNVVLRLTLPANVEPMNATPAWNSHIADTLTWNIGDITPEQVRTFTVRDSVLLALSIGDIVNFQGEVTMDEGADCNVIDNTVSYNQEIVGAIDPNDKLVHLKDGTSPGYVLKNEIATYKIRFQNIGSWYASRVIIVDTLSELIDIKSIDHIIGSHHLKAELEGRVLTFTFDNIQLPSEEMNEEQSHGFVQFNVRYLQNGTDYVEVHNDAHIQFDFEDYITTNKVTSTILPDRPTLDTKNSSVEIHPNPSRHRITVSLRNGGVSMGEGGFESINAPVYFNEIVILNLHGQIIDDFFFEMSTSMKIDISHLPHGTYMVQVTSQKGEPYYGKLIRR